MSDIWETLEARIKGKDITIVFPEGEDVRILGAVARHQKDGLIVPILLGNPEKVQAVAKEAGIDIDGVQIIDPDNYAEYDDMVAKFVERRKGKATEEKAETVYNNYYDYSELACRIPPHRLLAIDRGEREEALKVTVQPDEQWVMKHIYRAYVKAENDCGRLVRSACDDSFKRLIHPSLE